MGEVTKSAGALTSDKDMQIIACFGLSGEFRLP
jgi:hypothetical protein